MKGTYRQPRPGNTKQKGGNPSFYKPERYLSGECTNMNGDVIESGGKYWKGGEVKRKYKKRTDASYVRRLPRQVVKKLNDEVIYATVSLLKTRGGRQFWIAREESTEWDDNQCLDVEVLVGESISVESMDGAKDCWLQIEDEEIVDTKPAPSNGALTRLAGAI